MTRLLDRYLAVMSRVARIALWAGGALVLASAFLIGIEVVARKAFALSIGGADELSGYAVAIGTALGLAGTLMDRAHVRVDALYVRLPHRLHAILDLLALLALALFVGLLAVRAVAVLSDSLAFSARATTPLATPLWIPQSLWVAGLVLFILVVVPLSLRVVVAILAGDHATVRRLAGARTLEEDAAGEVENAVSTLSRDRRA